VSFAIEHYLRRKASDTIVTKMQPYRYSGILIVTICWCLWTTNSTKAFLRRNIFHCPRIIKSNCYKTFMQPILEYAAPVWSPFLQCQIYQIERIQHSMARFILNDYCHYSSVTNMINHLSWPTLESRRTFLKLLLFYKIERILLKLQ